MSDWAGLAHGNITFLGRTLPTTVDDKLGGLGEYGACVVYDHREDREATKRICSLK